MSLSFLWVAPKSPLPATDGARVASYNLIKGILERGNQIDLIIVPPVDEAPLVDVATLGRQLPVSSINVLPRPQASRGMRRLVSMGFSWAARPHLPMTVSSFGAPRVSRAMNDATRSHRGDLVVYEGPHVAAHLFDSSDNPALAAPYLLRAQNCETQLWSRKASLDPSALRGRLMSIQARAMARFEAAVVRGAQGVATVSDLDRSLFLRAVPALSPDLIVTVPVGYEFGMPLSLPDRDVWRLLFVGRLDWPPNREGLQWFLDAVWPLVVRDVPRWSLTIAGSGDGRWLARYRHLARVDIRGFVDDLEGLYKGSSLAIVPLFFGSGTRVKAIEAGRYGRPCLSTRVGVEGLGLSEGVDYLGAETVEEWIACLRHVTTERLGAMGQHAWQQLRANYDLQASASAFLALAARAAARRRTSSERPDDGASQTGESTHARRPRD